MSESIPGLSKVWHRPHVYLVMTFSTSDQSLQKKHVHYTIWTKLNYRPVDLKLIENVTIEEKLAKNFIYWASAHSILQPQPLYIHSTHPQEHLCFIFIFFNKTRSTWEVERSLSHWSHFIVQLQDSLKHFFSFKFEQYHIWLFFPLLTKHSFWNYNRGNTFLILPFSSECPWSALLVLKI